MRKRKLLAVLLACVLAVSAVALAGCGNGDKVKKAFEADPYVSEFKVDSDYVVDSPYAVTEFEVISESKIDGVPNIEFTATLENDSFKAAVQGIALPGDDDTFFFTVYDPIVTAKKGVDFLESEDNLLSAENGYTVSFDEASQSCVDDTFFFTVYDPIVTAKKGVDFLESEDNLLSAENGYTVSFDEASQSCVVTADRADLEDLGVGSLYKTGKQQFIFEEGEWQKTGDSEVDEAMEWNADAIEGTYKLQTKKPDVPGTVTISNVRPGSEDGSDSTFEIEYSFDGVDVKNEGTLSVEYDDNGDERSFVLNATGEYPAVNDDVDFIREDFRGNLVLADEGTLSVEYDDNGDERSFVLNATGEYPAVNDDVDFIREDFRGNLVLADGKTLLEDVTLSSSERTEDGRILFRIGSEDPFDVTRGDLVYGRQ